jgi:asparagine synthase (glutamine-hydrolysing)
MGAIYGVLNFDGRPVNSRKFNCITKSLGIHGPDGNSSWKEGQVSLGFQNRINTPEAHFESLPSRLHDLVITSKARIDNRNELLRQFGVPVSEWNTTTDSWLILHSFLKWGEDCCTHLLGDYCFAIWDIKQQSLFLGRDHFGTHQVFFYRGPSHFVFSSSLEGVLAWPDLPIELDQLALAASMTLVPFTDYSQTPYKNVHLLQPAHRMTVKNGRLEQRKYWSLKDIPDIRFSSDDEYIEGFQETFAKAVACRLRSSKPVGVMMSGGIDSSSVAVEAASQLARNGQELESFTSVPCPEASTIVTPREFGDEGALASTIAQKAGNIRSNLVTARNKSPLTAIDQAVSALRHPQFSASNSNWLLSICEEIRAKNLGSVLVGQYGNATISWVGNRSNYLRNLLSQRQWSTYLHEIQAFRNQLQLSLPGSMRSLVIAPMVPHQWFSRLYDMRVGPEPWKRYSPINPGFAKRLGLRQIASEKGVFDKNPHNPDYRKHFIHGGQFSMIAIGASLAAPFGLGWRDPTADKRVLEFCFGIPESQYVRNGESRRLIRRAMKGRLPPEVLLNPKKGLQSADGVWRVRESAAEISDALEKVVASDLAQEYLDVPRIRRAFEQALVSETLATRVETQSILLRGLAVARFLQGFED